VCGKPERKRANLLLPGTRKRSVHKGKTPMVTPRGEQLAFYWADKRNITGRMSKRQEGGKPHGGQKGHGTDKLRRYTKES